MKRNLGLAFAVGLLLILGACAGPSPTPKSLKPLVTVATATVKATKTPTNTPAVASASVPAPTETTAPTGTPSAPFPSAGLCPDHGELHANDLFHGLWDSNRGCHYDHEHGTNPFTDEVADAFPGLDLQSLLGGVQIGSTNPSSPIENVAKHGGMKWDVYVPTAHPCAVGFEGATVGISAAVIQYHAFGNYAIEFESRIHSSVALLRQCQPGDPNDVGLIFTPQFQEYGQRVTPYQGTLLAYPDTFQPTYDTPRGPYFTIDCVGVGPGCRPGLSFFHGNTFRNAASKWSSKPTGGASGGPRPETSILFRLLFDVRDTYQVVEWASVTDGYPFNFPFICSSDGGVTYNPVGCKYNNSTTSVHEIAGNVPAAWDNLDGWDTDPRVGRVTAEGYVSRFGMPTQGCSIPGMACFPVKLVSAFVGAYGADLCAEKCSLLTPANTPERDLYFMNGQVVAETVPGAVASGWIGAEN